MKVRYTPHHRVDAQGHLYIDKPGACCINLRGAAAMSQEELNFWAGLMAERLSNLTPDERRLATRIGS